MGPLDILDPKDGDIFEVIYIDPLVDNTDKQEYEEPKEQEENE